MGAQREHSDDTNDLTNDLEKVDPNVPILDDKGRMPLTNAKRFAAAIREAAASLPAARPSAPARPSVPTSTTPYRSSTADGDTCSRCHGTGRFRSYSGYDIGECFACRGTRAARPPEVHVRPLTSPSYIHAPPTMPAGKPYPNIRAAFDAVERRGLKKARITIGDIHIELAPPNTRNPGALYVKHLGEYVGKMDRDKSLVFSHKCKSPNTVLKQLDAIEVDPLAAITAQAATDAQRVAEAIAAGLEPIVSCCCCGIYLTDPISRERGVGPICAARWGLFGLSMPEALALDDL